MSDNPQCLKWARTIKLDEIETQEGNMDNKPEVLLAKSKDWNTYSHKEGEIENWFSLAAATRSVDNSKTLSNLLRAKTRGIALWNPSEENDLYSFLKKKRE